MNSGQTWQPDSTGPDVRILFVMTKLLDYNGIDGNFRPKTQDAVKSFQQSSNLTGVVGPETSQCRVRCRKLWRPAAALIRQRIPGLSMPTLAPGPNRPCAPINRSKTLQSTGLLGIRRGGSRQEQPVPR
jgi:peptidoglycan hydrolase-like protein with peptidoglycan-binding domain